MLKLSSSEIALEVLKSRRNISGQFRLRSEVFGKSSEIFGTAGTFFSKSRTWLNENLTHLTRKKLAGIFLPCYVYFGERFRWGNWFRVDRRSIRVKKNIWVFKNIRIREERALFAQYGYSCCICPLEFSTALELTNNETQKTAWAGAFI